jgi:uncharacterized membrane protein (UPF0127 family)
MVSLLKNFMRKTLLILVLAVLLWSCGATNAGKNEPGVPEVIRADGRVDFLNSEGNVLVSVTVEIADTPKAHTRGLMWRKGLDDTMGMLFIYEHVGELAFWMRNTPTPLDIIFISERGRVINIAANAKPMSDRFYYSKGLAKYVVEVVAGFCARYGVFEGTVIRWRRH